MIYLILDGSNFRVTYVATTPDNIIYSYKYDQTLGHLKRDKSYQFTSDISGISESPDGSELWITSNNLLLNKYILSYSKDDMNTFTISSTFTNMTTGVSVYNNGSGYVICRNTPELYPFTSYSLQPPTKLAFQPYSIGVAPGGKKIWIGSQTKPILYQSLDGGKTFPDSNCQFVTYGIGTSPFVGIAVTNGGYSYVTQGLDTWDFFSSQSPFSTSYHGTATMNPSSPQGIACPLATASQASGPVDFLLGCSGGEVYYYTDTF